jgi:hypothetical protein
MCGCIDMTCGVSCILLRTATTYKSLHLYAPRQGCSCLVLDLPICPQVNLHIAPLLPSDEKLLCNPFTIEYKTEGRTIQILWGVMRHPVLI